MGIVNKARREALAKGEKTYLSEKACVHCGTHEKWTNSYSCVECHKRRSLEKLNDKELMAKYRTPEKEYERVKKWRSNNYEKVRNQWLNPEHKHTRQDKDAKRRARKKDQMPPDADLTAIKLIYKQCVEITEQTGVPHEVDHIIPLSKGGLHHQDNLQIITRDENRKKGDKIYGDYSDAHGHPCRCQK